MPDVLHWFGVTKIDKLVSMSDKKYKAIKQSGIKVIERVTLPDYLVPEDAVVEIQAKKAAGYFTGDEPPPDIESLLKVKGRSDD